MDYLKEFRDSWGWAIEQHSKRMWDHWEPRSEIGVAAYTLVGEVPLKVFGGTLTAPSSVAVEAEVFVEAPSLETIPVLGNLGLRIGDVAWQIERDGLTFENSIQAGGLLGETFLVGYGTAKITTKVGNGTAKITTKVGNGTAKITTKVGNGTRKLYNDYKTLDFVDLDYNLAGSGASGDLGLAVRKIKKDIVRTNYKVGNDASNNISKRYPGSKREVHISTTDGSRYIDVLTKEGLAIESKVGRVSLSKSVKRQILKDLEILRDPTTPVSKLMWEFSKSPTTGKIGPTKALYEFIQKQKVIGIKID
jgi:hypothetical protein